MREILFRGKSATGEWITGDLLQRPNGVINILTLNDAKTGYYNHKVDADTVGQFTGLLDKNGKKIFEGDIFESSARGRYPVFFENGCFMSQLICDKPNSYMTKLKLCDIHHLITDECEVVGNKWDNPELLEGGLK